MPHKPIYKELYHTLKAKIENNLYKKGDLLPTEDELQEEYGVSRTTVRKAIALLQADGLIAVKQGYGTEILKNRAAQSLNSIISVSQSLRQMGHEVGVRNMHIERITPNRELAEELQIAEDEPVILISRIQTADGAPITVAKNYIPEKFVPGILGETEDIVSLYRYIDQKYSIKITKIADRLSACSATFDESVALGVEPKCALIVIRRVCYTSGVPFEVDYAKIVASKYEYKNYFTEE